MRTHAFIDASNLFYGGEKSLGWKIDYRKLLTYFHKKYKVGKTFYFGGIEIYDFNYDYLTQETVSLKDIEKHLLFLFEDSKEMGNEDKVSLLEKHLHKVRFYKKLKDFGYILFLKPVKLYEHEGGTAKKKANCDVDMAFHLMKNQDSFDRVLILSGDGDFLPVLKYLRDEKKKEVIILARGPRTAKEIRRFAGSSFRDFEYLRELLKRE